MDPEARLIVTARDTTGTAFASADRHLKSFARGVTQLRSGLSLLGVAFSGRALAQWMTRAVETTEAVGEQREAIESAKKSFQDFQKASDRLAESFAVHLTPSVNLLAKALDGIRQIYDPTEDEKLSQDIARIETEINRLASGIIKFEQGDFWRRLAGAEVWEKAREDVAELRVELERLYAERDKRAAGKSQIITQDELIRLETFIYELNQKPPLITQQELVALETFIYDLNQALNDRPPFITLEETIALEEFINELNAVPERLTQEEWIDLESFIYDLNHMEQEANQTAQYIGETFRDAFTDWILGAERDFGELLRRMATQMAVSGIFDAFATAFSGGTSGFAKFMSSFFGGARADGGPVSAGRSYLVGERGPEIFTPGTSGMISAGGGIAIHMGDTNIDARGADSSLIQRLPKILDDHRQRTKAEIADLIRRNRFATA